MKAFKNQIVLSGMWFTASLAMVTLTLLYIAILLAGFSLAVLAFTAYLWCLWNFPALTITVGCSFLMLVFLITKTTMFDGIFKG